ncbi:MAG: GC-type dockerin domain-anchored protein [Phycisphaerales bacterium]
MNPIARATTTLALAASSLLAADGIRVVTWNITYYDGTRAEQIGTVCYDTWDGKQLDPDVICLQEMTGRVPTIQFVEAMNDAPGSPGDWAAAPIYVNPRGGLHTALVYRTSKLEFIEAVLIAAGDGPPQQPRNVVRFDLRAVGYEEDESILSFFPLHYKAGYTQSDLDRKLVESQIVRQHIETLPANRHVILGADLNIRHSTDPAYEELNGVIPNTSVLWDPISTPGTWHNSAAFRNIHTQDPTGGGGMDDRLDQILLSPSLLDGTGFEYDGNFPVPWDLSTTEDPNHSHRAWGNDGSRFNQGLRIAGNTMVGPTIAQAIADLADPDGHIPVYLDLDVPPRIRVIGQSQDLGTLAQGESRDILIRIGNDADTNLWGTSGISPLNYTLAAPPTLSALTGPFQSAAGTQLTSHLLTLDTSTYTTPGPHTEHVTIHTDDPASPEALIDISFQLTGCNQADLAQPLGTHDFFDVSAFLTAFSAASPEADINQDGQHNFFDVSAFLTTYTQGCPR